MIPWYVPGCGNDDLAHTCPIADWVSVAPIWVLPDYFDWLKRCGVRRLVALSSTSRFTKGDSIDLAERSVAAKLENAEAQLTLWAEQGGIDCVILRPTLIHGYRRDRNITAVIDFVERFGFFPLVGPAAGLRQPIHADDVATACVAALLARDLHSAAFNIAGAETLSYRDMVIRIFEAMGRRPRLLTIPWSLAYLGVNLLRVLPQFRGINLAMAHRMSVDLVFDGSDAHRALGFKAGAFRPDAVLRR